MADCETSRWLRRLALWLLIPCAQLACFGQSTGKATVGRRTQVSGGAQINSPYSRYVQIMALFPPAYNPGPNSDYTNFQNNVMAQTDANGLPIVDGVTLEIVWSNVETQAPSPTSCGNPSDICQLDAVGQYHTYSWGTYDNNASMVYPNSVIPWFSSFGVGPRKVNFILSGINTLAPGGLKVNSATPWYVTSSGYLANFTPSRQDVMNSVTCPSTTPPWQGIAGAGYMRSSGSTTVTATSSNCCGTGNPIQGGDPIWVSNGGNVDTVPSATVQSVTYPDTFTYTSLASTPVSSCPGCVYISAFESSPVPYEKPYTVAWESFLAAANLHFSPSYSPHGTNLGSQLGYMRSGTWVGGESYVYCSADLALLGYPYAYSTSVWLADYQNKVNYVESLTPTMARYWPIDPNTMPDTMAQYATSAANGHGFINGFGSQGLSAADYQAGCSGANADWCNLFTGGMSRPPYNLYGMPLELQQISISDETQSCSSAGACGTPPKSAGDLRLWLPFAVQNNATVFEMYYLDLALAFDANYCTAPSNRCTTLAACSAGYTPNSAFMNTTQQTQWNCDVGLGNSSCPSGSSCYATYIKNNHGPMY